jgi:hypothetical protein
MLDNALRDQLAKRLREIHADIKATEIPPRFARLLDEPPDDHPPRGAPGQRIVQFNDELPEQTEATERKALAK